jgi:hypothetical protein
MRAHLTEPLTVERLACRAAMSPRNFARAFAAETGTTPAKAVERLRLEDARMAIENSHAPLERIAEAVGSAMPVGCAERSCDPSASRHRRCDDPHGLRRRHQPSLGSAPKSFLGTNTQECCQSVNAALPATGRVHSCVSPRATVVALLNHPDSSPTLTMEVRPRSGSEYRVQRRSEVHKHRASSELFEPPWKTKVHCQQDL